MKNIKVHFKTRNGQVETVEAPEFNTLMEASRYYSKNGYIDSIDADCGGACSCATCHVWIDEKLEDGFFVCTSASDHVKFDWIVTGGRKDAVIPEVEPQAP